eukprot:1819980-Pleurochrysis_carterae.AAC.2
MSRQPELDPGKGTNRSPHWRRGLVGALQDWAQGRLANAIKLIVTLCKPFNVLEGCAGGANKARCKSMHPSA